MLSDFEERFCHEYLTDLNATKAYARAKGRADRPRKGDRSAASRLRTLKCVDDRIVELIAARNAKVDIDNVRVVQHLAAIAFSSMADFVETDENGNRRITLDRAPQEALIAVTQFKTEVDATYSGDGDNRKVVSKVTKSRIKLNGDKFRALIKLGEHIGLFTKGGDELAAFTQSVMEGMTHPLPSNQPVSERQAIKGG
ncbi:hypothetical protein JANAI61_37250 [Jannaschia sp. AI_61]|nr:MULTISPECIES: terminase small subunit [unclassified Jannaschia]GIT93267.1 hypothetical protein JANAI61_37250 [Jannaschia sp. AI_61]